MRTTQPVLGSIATAKYSCAGEQVGAKILTLPLAKPSDLTLAAGQRTKGHSYPVFPSNLPTGRYPPPWHPLPDHTRLVEALVLVDTSPSLLPSQEIVKKSRSRLLKSRLLTPNLAVFL